MPESINDLKNIFERYEAVKYNFFKWRFESTFANKFALAIGFACMTGLFAQLRFYLPFTPVPVTGQVFAVLLSGVILGKWYGGLSQGLYAIIGVLGVPWFADAKSGMAILAGVTGGYIIGFIVASLIIGWFTDRYVRSRSSAGLFVLMLFGIVIIHIFGVIHLSGVLGVSILKAIELGSAPFIVVDMIKASAASAIAVAITPRTAYGNEVDSG